MLMAFPFLMLEDIDEVWQEMIDIKPDLGSDAENAKVLITKFCRVNAGQEKNQSSAQKVKDAEIAVLKLKYKYGELEVMDYLMKISVYSKIYDD